MPFVEQDDVGGFVSDPLLPKEPMASPGVGATLGAAFRLENDAFAAYDLMTRDRGFKPDANFNAITRLRDFDTENRTSLYDNYKENFIGVRSQEEFQSVLDRINKEQVDRETLEAAGAGGVVSAIAAGVLSPTMLLPFIGSGRGLKAVAGAAAWGGVAGAVQELPLQLAQETRTAEESVFAIAAGTVMGGLLGGAVQVLRRGEFEALETALQRDADMVRSNFGQAIPSSSGSLGAAASMDEYAGVLKGGVVNKVADWLGPVTRVINQEDNRTMSWAMSQLSDAGLRMEGNTRGIATSAGGTVESRIKTYMGSFAQVTEGLDGNYAKYVFGENNVPGLAPNIRAAIAGSMDAQKLSKHEFKEEISRALREGDAHVIPEVAAVAREIRAKIFDPILKEAQAAGIYKDINVLGDTSYLHRVYNHEKIGANTNAFVEVLAKHYAEKLNTQYGEELTKLEGRSARDKQLIEDLVRPREEVEAIRNDLREQLREIETGVRRAKPKTVSQFYDELVERLKTSDLDEGQTSRVPEKWELEEARVDAKYEYLKSLGVKFDNYDQRFAVSETLSDPWWGKVRIADRFVANTNLSGPEARALMDTLPPEKDINKFIDQAIAFNKETPFDRDALAKILPENLQAKLDDILKDGSGGYDWDTPDLSLIKLLEEAYPALKKLGDAAQDVPESFAARDRADLYSVDMEKQLDRMISAANDRPTAQTDVTEVLRSPRIIAAEDQIAELRSMARLAAKAGDDEARKAFLSDARQIERSMGEELKDVRLKRSAIRSRMQGLARAAVALEERQLKKLEQIEKIEGVNERQLMQVARAGQRILNKLDTVSDKELDGLLKELQAKFTDLSIQLEKGEARLAKLVENETADISLILRADEGVQAKTGRLSEIADDMEALDTIDRSSVRASIMEALNEINQRALNQIEKRLLRENKLIEAAAKLDPAEATRRVDNLKGISRERRINFIESVRARGGDAIDIDARSADFSAHARQLAEQVKDKIMATNVRLPLNDVMAAERGAELARVLDIPSAKIEAFLENDVERVLRTYLRTLPADIEIKKKFGDVNGQEIFQKATEELNNKIVQLNERATEEAWSEAKLQKATKDLNKQFRDRHRDLEVVIGRLRGTHGLPDNPDGMAYRMARTVMNLNVLRLMGGTLISSIPDAARPIMRYGLTRTFQDGFVPLFKNFQQIKVASREAKLAGAALDAILHTRAQSVHDVMDDFGRHSKFERGVEFATNKMGAVALFDYWTVAMKQFSSSVIITKLTDSLDIVVGGAKASAKEVKEAQEFLANKGLTGELAERTYAQLNNGKGGERVNGVLMPNTEAWVDDDAVRAFRSAIVSEVDNTIITPGVERPVWMTSSTLGRVLGQFKSFGMSSTFKVLNAGLQQRDMAFVNGTMASLALGALSYYLYAVAAGGDTYEKMLKGGPAKFADEAINRSGLLGVFSEGQRFLERIPATQPFANFSGDRTARRGGGDIIDILGGPSFGAAKTAARILQDLDDPTKSTLHAALTLAPFRNLVYLRQLLDQIEASSGLPERRN